MYCLLRALVVTILFITLRTVAQVPQCMPELGTGIKLEHCTLAMRELIYAGGKRGATSWEEWNEERVFMKPPNVVIFPQVLFNPRQVIYGTCQFSVHMEKDRLSITSSWRDIVQQIRFLLQECVQKGDVGGDHASNGFRFRVERPGRSGTHASASLSQRLGPLPAGHTAPNAFQQVPGVLGPPARAGLKSEADQPSSPKNLGGDPRPLGATPGAPSPPQVLQRIQKWGADQQSRSPASPHRPGSLQGTLVPAATRAIPRSLRQGGAIQGERLVPDGYYG